MKHKAKITVETEKRGLFGKKKVLEKRTIWVDGSTYRKMQKEKRNRPYTIEEMMFYDFIFGN